MTQTSRLVPKIRIAMRLGLLIVLTLAVAWLVWGRNPQGGLASLTRLMGLGPSVGLDPERPNILIIYSDDQDFGDIDWFAKKGGRRTPVMDALFERGVWLSQARVTTSMCTPSRYGLHTGHLASGSFADPTLVARRNALGWPSVENHRDLVLRGTEASAGRLFQAAGYYTGFVGKWHLSGLHRGGDDAPDLQAYKAADEAKVADLGGFDVVSGLYMTNISWQAKRLNLPEGMAVQNPGYLTENAVGFIRQAARRRAKEPFFMIYAPTLVHSPMVRGGDDPQAGPYGRLDHTPRRGIGWEETKQRVDGHPTRRDRTVISLDYSIGEIMKALRDHRLESNTLIVFMSDNNKAKSSLYDDGLLVPTAIFWPGRIAPGEVSGLFANIDILPTVLDAAGIDFEPEHFDGRSAWPALTGQGPLPRQDLLLEQGYARAVVTLDGWKYVRVERPQAANPEQALLKTDYSARPLAAQSHRLRRVWEWHPGFFADEQLYDLNQDPNETQNLADDADQDQRLQAMRRLLEQNMHAAAANDWPR